MVFSKEIIKKVLQYVRFRVPQTEEKNSYYTEIGNTLVRVSNHCTWLYRWDEILEKNPKWKGKPIVSIIFEDSGNTFSDECLVLRKFRMKPIKVMEYVYPLQGNPQFITPQDERLIINGIKQIQGGKYTDLTNKCSEPILRISQNPSDVPPTKTMNNNENKQYKNNTNMKQTIKLTESDLHRIVKESVKREMKETSNNLVTRAYQKSLRRGNEKHYPKFRDELDRRYSNQFMDNNGFYKDMEDDEIRNTEAYKIAYNILDDYAYERGDEPMNDWQTCYDIMEYTRIPQNIVWFAISDWKDANNVE